MFTIRRLTPKDLPRLNQFWIEHWGGYISEDSHHL